MDTKDVNVTVSGGISMREPQGGVQTPEQRAREGRFHEGGLYGVSLHRHARGLRITLPDQRVDGVPTALLTPAQARELADSLEVWLDEQEPATDEAERKPATDADRPRHRSE